MHFSVPAMWQEFISSKPDKRKVYLTYDYWHFGDNPHDANHLAELVLQGEKTATAPSVWELELQAESIPKPGDLHIITNWDGVAKCIIKTTDTEIVLFNKVTPGHARREGEGDISLEYWRQTHWEYYQRMLKDSENEPTEDMPIVCEQFEVIYQ